MNQKKYSAFLEIVLKKLDEENIDFFYSLMQKYVLRKEKKYLLVKNENGEKIRLYSKITNREISLDDVRFFQSNTRKIKDEKIIYIVNKLGVDVKELTLNFEFITVENLYEKYLKENFKLEKKQKKSSKLKTLLEIAFTRKNARKYLGLAFIFAFFNLFLRYNVYYLIWTTLMFIFSLICIFMPKQKHIQVEEDLKLAVKK